MAKVMKGNRQLTVSDEVLQDYLDKGYNEIDQDGKIIRTGKVVTLADCQERIKELEQALAVLDVTANELTQQNLALTARIAEYEAADAGKFEPPAKKGRQRTKASDEDAQ